MGQQSPQRWGAGTLETTGCGLSCVTCHPGAPDKGTSCEGSPVPTGQSHRVGGLQDREDLGQAEGLGGVGGFAYRGLLSSSYPGLWAQRLEPSSLSHSLPPAPTLCRGDPATCPPHTLRP